MVRTKPKKEKASKAPTNVPTVSSRRHRIRAKEPTPEPALEAENSPSATSRTDNGHDDNESDAHEDSQEEDVLGSDAVQVDPDVDMDEERLEDPNVVDNTNVSEQENKTEPSDQSMEDVDGSYAADEHVADESDDENDVSAKLDLEPEKSHRTRSPQATRRKSAWKDSEKALLVPVDCDETSDSSDQSSSPGPKKSRAKQTAKAEEKAKEDARASEGPKGSKRDGGGDPVIKERKEEDLKKLRNETPEDRAARQAERRLKNIEPRLQKDKSTHKAEQAREGLQDQAIEASDDQQKTDYRMLVGDTEDPSSDSELDKRTAKGSFKIKKITHWDKERKKYGIRWRSTIVPVTALRRREKKVSYDGGVWDYSRANRLRGSDGEKVIVHWNPSFVEKDDIKKKAIRKWEKGQQEERDREREEEEAQ